MSRLHCFHNVAHHQTENLFAGCGQLSECPRSIQRLIFFSSITNPPKLHQLQCAWLTGCWRLHPPPPRCPLSSRDGWLGSSWKDKDGRGKLFSVPLTIISTSVKINPRWFMVKWCWGRSVRPSSALYLQFSAACWLSLGCRSLTIGFHQELVASRFTCIMLFSATFALSLWLSFFRPAQQGCFTFLYFWRSHYLLYWWPLFPIHLRNLSQISLKCETGAGKQGACNCSLVGILWRLCGRPWWSLHIQVNLVLILKLTDALQRRKCSTARKQGTRRICTWGGCCVSTASNIHLTGEQWDWEFPGNCPELRPEEGHRGGHQPHCWDGNSLARGGEQGNSGLNHLVLVPGWIWIASSWQSWSRPSTSCSTGIGSQVGRTSTSHIQHMTHRVEDDSESECGDLVGQLALPGMFCLQSLSHVPQLFHVSSLETGVGDSSGEEDSLDLEP